MQLMLSGPGKGVMGVPFSLDQSPADDDNRVNRVAREVRLWGCHRLRTTATGESQPAASSTSS